MNIQQSPRKTTAEIEQQLGGIDRVTRSAEGSVVGRHPDGIAERGRGQHPQELTPPAYGEDHRKFIDTCVEGIVSDLCRKMEGLHEQLRTIEQQVLGSAEKARNALREHAAVCIRVNDEIKAMGTVITDLAEQTRG
jgi:hypothetical protein